MEFSDASGKRIDPLLLFESRLPTKKFE